MKSATAMFVLSMGLIVGTWAYILKWQFFPSETSTLSCKDEAGISTKAEHARITHEGGLYTIVYADGKKALYDKSAFETCIVIYTND